MSQARDEAEAGNFHRASDLLRSALRYDPRNAGLRYNLGFVLERAGEIAGAFEAYEEARQSPEFLVPASENLALLLLRLGDSEGAAHVLETAIERRPESGSLRYHLGLVLLRTSEDRVEPAAEQLRAARSLGFERPHLFLLLGRIARTSGDRDRAREHLERGLSADPGDASLRRELALLLEESGDLEGAAGEFRAAIEAGGERGSNLRDLGRVQLRRDRADDAVTVLREAMEARPEDPEVLYLLARAQRRLSLPEAEATLARFEELQLRQETARAARRRASAAESEGVRLWAAGDIEAAGAKFDEVLQLWPQSHRARAYSAAVHLEKGDVDRARELAESVLAGDPDNPQALVVLGRIQFDVSPERGLETLERAVASHPYRVSCLVALAEAYVLVGRLDDAEALGRKAREIDPDARGVRALLHRLGAERQRDSDSD